MKTQIVIGASAAGIGALLGLRQHDSKSKIICISEQDSLPYNKCLLADFICKQVEKERLFTKDQNFFEQNGIQLLLSSKVTKIIPDKNQIVLNGQILSYDNLFLGLGTDAILPKISGIEKITDIFTFHTLTDARKILNFIKQNKVQNATIIGAGLSGIELADALTALELQVTVLEKNDQLLPHQIDSKGSQIIEEALLKNGVKVYTNENVLEIGEQTKQDKKVFSLQLSSFKKLQTDLVIFAMGSKPNSELAKNAGIKIENGRIFTNERMQTNFANIYAGGDVCLVKDMISGQYVPSCTWPDAIMQGMSAGANMAGDVQTYSGVLTTISSKIFDTAFVSCGPVVRPPQDSKCKIKEGANFYHKFLILKDRLIGFLMVGKVDNIGKLKSYILKKETFPADF